MQRTRIEWCDYTLNPVKGMCPVDCKDNQGRSYCYARRMYKRFGWNPEIRYENSWISDLANIKKPSRIFVGSTIELFGEWVKYWWLKTIFDFALLYPQHTFIFLTKKPENLSKWSPFPENCWVGASATGNLMMCEALTGLASVTAKVKFVSLEPLLDRVVMNEIKERSMLRNLDWLIIGQQTPPNKKTEPKIEWIREIVEAADKAGIPVFLKNNLRDLIYGEYGGKYKQIFKYSQDGSRELRQEFPKQEQH